MESKQCTQCRQTSLFEEFKMNKRTGQLTKQCIKCLDSNKICKERNKFQHGKQKSKCKECGGSEICEHERVRYRRKECGGTGICKHNRPKTVCVECEEVKYVNIKE